MHFRIVLGVVAPALVLASALSPTTALADGKAACVDASKKGQRLRDGHQLVEAREQLRICAAAGCPAVVQSDCATWLADVERALPTVVVTAKNRAGADLVDVKVTVDGQPLASKLDGQAVAMNAGPHTFHLEGADGAVFDQQVLVKEGEKNQPVAAVLGAEVPAPAPPAPIAPPPSPATSAPSEPASPDPSPSSSGTWKTVGWVVGGVGVAGLGVGAVFGLVAMGDKNGAHCSNNLCDPGTSSGIKSAALVSDIGWIAGGVLLASGAALVLFAPGGHASSSTAGVRVVPVATANGGSVILGATF